MIAILVIGKEELKMEEWYDANKDNQKYGLCVPSNYHLYI